jgi:spermidine synthase
MSQQAPFKWFAEKTTTVEIHLHALTRIVFSGESAFQRIEILDTASFGKCLVLDGLIQSSVADDFIYHETLVHPAMIQHERPETALVIGGGEGATLREVLRYPTIRRAVMIDIDQAVIEACKVHLPEMHRGSFSDERAELRFEDARAYLEATRERFDVAFIDLTEPMEEGPARFLFTREFYRLVSDRLTDRGVMSMQAGMTRVGELRFYAAMVRTLSSVFPAVAPYQSFIPCFATPWGFIMGGKAQPPSLSVEEIDRRVKERVDGDLGFYDGSAHRHMFSLPKFLKEATDRSDLIVTDEAPLLVSYESPRDAPARG